MSARVIHGDCITEMAAIPESSVDAIVCDPPYGLEFMGKEWDSPWKRGDDINTDAGFNGGGVSATRNAPSFTSSTNPKCQVCKGTRRGRRDGTAKVSVCLCADGGRFPNVRAAEMLAFQQWCEVWCREALRVLKPGGHLLAFGGTRTWHRLAVAVEDAGFEIRDSIAWLYGSGFPKSLDVSKAIDKAAGAERKVVGNTAEHSGRTIGMGSSVRGGYEGGAIVSGHCRDITAPATPEAEQWQGWGTALKPAFEPVVVARKPLAARTVAGNVLAHGTGALNIDACRIGGGQPRPAREAAGRNGAVYGAGLEGSLAVADTLAGRWPANVVLDGRTEPVLRLRYNLPVEVERTIRESFGASTGHLPAVRNLDHSATEPSDAAEVLLSPVPSGVDVGEPDWGAGAALGQAAHPGDAGEDRSDEAAQSSNGREVPCMERRTVSEPGVRVREAERASGARAGVVRLDVNPQRGDVHPGASAGDRSPTGPSADAGRARASHQRAEGGQPTGEPGISPVEQFASDEARRGGRGDVQAAQGERGAAVAPLEILHSQCPPRWRQYFVVVGESQSQAAALDEQSGTLTSGVGAVKRKSSATRNGNQGAAYGSESRVEGAEMISYGDTGGASRFFYVAKVPKRERPVVDGVAHPTVKPLALMRWLVRLVTPPGGKVLDPFGGSGTTAEAALLEGFDVIVIEREADYLPLIAARIDRVALQESEREPEPWSLFDEAEGA